MIKTWYKQLKLFLLFYFVTILSLVAQNVPFTCDANAYFSHHESGGDLLYRFTPDYNFSLIKKLDFSVNGIAFNPNDNFLYGINESTDHIVRIDQNGDYIDLGMPDGIQGDSYWAGTFTKDGNMIVSGGGGAWILVLDVTVSPPSIISAKEKFYADGSSGKPSFGDIAVDPISGICYAVDNSTKKACKININTGSVEVLGAAPVQNSASNGALYFDGSGELTAFFLKDIYKVNKLTGEFSYSGEGLDINTGIDACSCVNPIQFNKAVTPAAACAGDTVTFTFSLVNNSELPFSNIEFSDPIPIELEIINTPSNTFGGTFTITPLAGQYNLLNIIGMELPVGTSEFTITTIANSTSNDFQTVANQARMAGFSPAWESILNSNNPLTSTEGDATEIIISPTPLQDLSFQILDGACEGSSLSIFIEGPGTGDFDWELPDGNSFDEQLYIQPSASLTDAGIYNIEYTDRIGCQIDTSVTINILPAPNLDLGNDSLTCLLSPISIFAGNHSNYLWQDGSIGNSFLVEDYGTYHVTVENENGCSATDSILISSNCTIDLFVPNAFSPNGDGYNDIFLAYGVEVVEFNLKIFDRWGAFLFESNDIQQGWDGYFKGRKKQVGIYVYLIEATFLRGEKIRKKGDITLIR